MKLNPKSLAEAIMKKHMEIPEGPETEIGGEHTDEFEPAEDFEPQMMDRVLRALMAANE